MRSLIPKVFLVCVLVLALSSPNHAQEWGTVKGRVTWGGDNLPPRVKLIVTKDQAHCLCKGDLFSEEYLVDKNGGVKNVFAWLIDSENSKKKLPLHPALESLRQKEVILDQPFCTFEPHALALRQGQILIARNSSPIAHNLNWQGGADNPGDNKIIPPNGQIAIDTLKGSPRPIKLACNIHPWMNAWIRVFDHPYFALTDAEGRFQIRPAPAGKYNLVLWHEGAAWINGGRYGQTIEIQAGGVVEVGAWVKPIRKP